MIPLERSPGVSERKTLLSTTHVAKVRKLFPDWDEDVSRLAPSDGAFRDLCEKYGRAVEALDLLEQRNRPRDVGRMYDYRTLIRELEKNLKYELLAARDTDQPERMPS